MFKSFYDPEVEKRGIAIGFEKGIQKGIEQGIEQGIEKGVQQGQDKAKVEIARNMISRGYNKMVVIELTGLSEEQVEKLFKEKVN